MHAHGKPPGLARVTDQGTCGVELADRFGDGQVADAAGQGNRTIECLAGWTRSGVHRPKYRLAEVLAGSQGKL